MWQPRASLTTLRQRARLLAAARAFFHGRGLLEVETPALVRHAVTDPHLRNVDVQLASGEHLFLHTSPEFHMKRLLAAGAPDLWQLGKVFRDGESGRRHEPEFTMIEWYRHDYTLDELATETCSLLQALAQEAETAGATPGFGRLGPTRWTYATLFEAATGIDPLAAGPAELKSRAGELLGPDALAGTGMEAVDEPTLWLDLLMSHAIARFLADTDIAVVTGYPASQAALARLDPTDRRIAERLEVFCRGIEVANGYRELRDPAEQERRFASDRAMRSRLGLPDVVPDPALLAALEHGLPDCAGVAVGFDRVVMVLLGLDSLQDTLSFPVREG